MKAKPRTTKIRVLGETWRVPRGFGRIYLRCVNDDLERARAGKSGRSKHFLAPATVVPRVLDRFTSCSPRSVATSV